MALVLLITCLLSPCASVAQDGEARAQDLLKRVERTVDGHVLPTLADFSKKAHRLADQLATFCASRDQAEMAGVKEAFGESVLAWARAEHLRFGPLGPNGRSMRINFWPDPHGVTWRQMRRVLQAKDAALLDPDTLAKQSVAVQGLGALEVILLRWSREPAAKAEEGQSSYECRYAEAIARNVANVSDQVMQDWKGEDGWRSRFLKPGPDNPVYRTAEEAAAQLTKSMLLGLALLQDQHVLVLFEFATGERKRIKLPFRRSGLSVDYIRASAESLKQFHEHFRLTDYARGEVAWTKSWTEETFVTLNQTARRLKISDKGRLVKSDLDVDTLRRLRFYTNGLRQIYGRALAPAAGLTIGFNELDGD